MTRILSIVLAFVLAVGCVGCGTAETFTDDGGKSAVTMQETPRSTAFSSVGYDRATQTLYVTFRESGVSYAYSDVPYSTWQEFQSADSMGGYFNQNIKGWYEYTRLD